MSWLPSVKRPPSAWLFLQQFQWASSEQTRGRERRILAAIVSFLNVFKKINRLIDLSISRSIVETNLACFSITSGW